MTNAGMTNRFGGNVAYQRTPTKIAIVGGAGAVGASAAYALMMSGLASEIVLIDVNQRRVEGEAMDLMQGSPFVQPRDRARRDIR
jgi:L-lactate dehydrogenase